VRPLAEIDAEIKNVQSSLRRVSKLHARLMRLQSVRPSPIRAARITRLAEVDRMERTRLLHLGAERDAAADVSGKAVRGYDELQAKLRGKGADHAKA
jgi:hypothetical protein